MQQVQEKEMHSNNREGARLCPGRAGSRGNTSLAPSFLPHPCMAVTVCFHLESCPTLEGMNSMHQDTELEWRLEIMAGSLGTWKFSWQRVEATPRATGVSTGPPHTYSTNVVPDPRSCDKQLRGELASTLREQAQLPG